MLARLALFVATVVPVPGPVLRTFSAPSCDRCAGHRGVTIGSTPGSQVRAPVAGTVVFSGRVADRRYVVIVPARAARTALRTGIVKVTVGWMASVGSEVIEGVPVAEGQALGSAGESTYLSVRVDGVHVEPLRALGLGWARLRGTGGVLVGPGRARR